VGKQNPHQVDGERGIQMIDGEGAREFTVRGDMAAIVKELAGLL
jgi:hypothetical protein